MAAVTEPPRRGISLGLGVGLCVVAAGVAIGLRPLSDNSFFTHLSTGRLILDRGAVPSHDPYTFTAQGEPWVVQSWLASVLYATAERLGGALGLRLVSGAISGALTAILWRLARPADGVLGRVLIVGLAVGVGGELWGERPFMLGLVALALLVLAAEDGLDPRWLVPVGWIWVNAHGSFPLGLAYLVVAAVGRRLDGGSVAIERRCFGWAGLGMLLGAIGPVGPKLLVFPVELLQKQELLRHVIEWQAPTFESLSQRVFLVELVIAIVVLARRPSYRTGLLIGVFAAAALVGSRNVTVASIVLVPGLAAGMPMLGTLRSDARTLFAKGLAGVGLAVFALVAVVRLDEPPYSFGGYPVDAVAFLDASEVDLRTHRLAAQDYVGNYLELVYGPGERVFYDDRFDMFPDAASDAHFSLVQAQSDVRSQLDRYDIELVVWERTSAVAPRLVVDPDWRVLFADDAWVLVCRRGASLGGRLDTC